MLEKAMEPVVILFIGAFFGLCSEGIYRGAHGAIWVSGGSLLHYWFMECPVDQFS